MSENLLEVTDLEKHFPITRGVIFRRKVGAVRAVDGIEFESIDGKPTNLVFMLVAPASSTGVHLKALARLSRLFRDADFRKRLLDAPSGEAMYQVIVEEDSKY